MATFEEYVILLNDKFSAGIKKAGDQAKGFKNNVEKINSQISGMGALFSGAIIGGVGAKMLMLASDFEETSSKFSVVFRDVAGEAENTARMLEDSYGLSSLASKKLLSDTGDLLTGFGFSGDMALDVSTEVQKLAVDLASFTNFSGGAQGASEALTKALLGERESVKALGIAILDEDVKARVKQLESMGKVNGMTERQKKAYATLSLAQEQSKNAIGDYARTSDSFANVIRVLQERFKDLGVVIGQVLMPVIRPMVDWLGRIVKYAKENEDKFKSLVKAIAVMTAAVAAFIVVLKIINLVMALNPFNLWVIAITALIGVLVYAWNASEKFRGVLLGIWEVLKWVYEVIKDKVLGIMDVFSNGWKGIGDAIKNFVLKRIDLLLLGLKGMGIAIKELFTGNFKEAAAAAGKAYVDLTGVFTGKGYDDWAKLGQTVGQKFNEGFAKGKDAEKITMPGFTQSTSAGGGGGVAGELDTKLKAETATVTGSAPKIFNINIDKMTGVEQFINQRGTVSESKEDIAKVFTNLMLEMLADVQIARV